MAEPMAEAILDSVIGERDVMVPHAVEVPVNAGNPARVQSLPRTAMRLALPAEIEQEAIRALRAQGRRLVKPSPDVESGHEQDNADLYAGTVILAGGIKPSGKNSYMRGRTYRYSQDELDALECRRYQPGAPDHRAPVPVCDDPSRMTVLPDGVAEGAESMVTLGGLGRNLFAPSVRKAQPAIGLSANHAARMIALGMDVTPYL